MDKRIPGFLIAMGGLMIILPFLVDFSFIARWTNFDAADFFFLFILPCVPVGILMVIVGALLLKSSR